MDNSNNRQSVLSSGPVVTRALFSHISGLPEDIVRGMIDRGHLPSVKIGRYRLINLALLTKESLDYELDR